MRKRGWMSVLIALMACGLIAVGCGSSDDSTTGGSTSSDATSSSDTTGSDTTSTTSSTGNTPDDVYNACIDAISGSPAQAVGKTACESARSAFQQCSDQASQLATDAAKNAAVDACQKAADSAISTLKASS